MDAEAMSRRRRTRSLAIGVSFLWFFAGTFGDVVYFVLTGKPIPRRFGFVLPLAMLEAYIFLGGGLIRMLRGQFPQVLGMSIVYSMSGIAVLTEVAGHAASHSGVHQIAAGIPTARAALAIALLAFLYAGPRVFVWRHWYLVITNRVEIVDG